jgi:hypothetical protein
MDERRRHCDGYSSKKATKIITKALCVYELIDGGRGKGSLLGGGGAFICLLVETGYSVQTKCLLNKNPFKWEEQILRIVENGDIVVFNSSRK